MCRARGSLLLRLLDRHAVVEVAPAVQRLCVWEGRSEGERASGGERECCVDDRGSALPLGDREPLALSFFIPLKQLSLQDAVVEVAPAVQRLVFCVVCSGLDRDPVAVTHHSG